MCAGVVLQIKTHIRFATHVMNRGCVWFLFSAHTVTERTSGLFRTFVEFREPFCVGWRRGNGHFGFRKLYRCKICHDRSVLGCRNALVAYASNFLQACLQPAESCFVSYIIRLIPALEESYFVPCVSLKLVMSLFQDRRKLLMHLVEGSGGFATNGSLHFTLSIPTMVKISPRWSKNPQNGRNIPNMV